LGSSPCICLLVHHFLSLYSTLLVHHSLSLYILICLLYKGTLLYCIIYFNIQRLFINLTWYQSHCSKCFVQSSSFLAFYRCLNHLRYCSAPAVTIPVCSLPSKVEQSPKTHCLHWNFLSRISIETPPHHWKALSKTISAAQKSPPSDAGRAATRRLKNLPAVTPFHAPPRAWLQFLPRVNLQARHVSPKSRSALDPRQP
jgi:hypothetical protein